MHRFELVEERRDPDGRHEVADDDERNQRQPGDTATTAAGLFEAAGMGTHNTSEATMQLTANDLSVSPTILPRVWFDSRTCSDELVVLRAEDRQQW